MTGGYSPQSQHAPTVRVVSTLRPGNAPRQTPPQIMQAQAMQRRAVATRRQV
jgi:hypothetical protein